MACLIGISALYQRYQQLESQSGEPRLVPHKERLLTGLWYFVICRGGQTSCHATRARRGHDSMGELNDRLGISLRREDMKEAMICFARGQIGRYAAPATSVSIWPTRWPLGRWLAAQWLISSDPLTLCGLRAAAAKLDMSVALTRVERGLV